VPRRLWTIAFLAHAGQRVGEDGGVVLGAAATMVAAADAGVVPGVDAVGVVIV